MTSTSQRRAIVVGSGIAGLSAALHLGNCTVITKSFLGAGSTRLAQGGLAAAVGPDDSPDQHVADTLRVAVGLADPETVEIVASGAPEGVSWLAELGVAFDREDGALSLGREAGHSRHRIVHAAGDATGQEMVRALTEAVRDRDDIEVLEETFAADIEISNGGVVALSVIDQTGEYGTILTANVVLATGGIGQLYSATTNPIESTGDGLAIAWRAGAVIQDCEFVQFHPTALAADRDPLPLLTEALRGAGGVLVDERGDRFMLTVHEDAELAPRDVVSRAIWQELQDGSVYLDVTGVPDVARRFPTAVENTALAGFDIENDLVPVTPAQHYFMGGVAVDHEGRSSIPGLYAAGEVTSSGLHGANRLASNSLVEGLVFGRSIADSIRNDQRPWRGDTSVHDVGRSTFELAPSDPLPDAVEELREIMWLHGGIVRSGAGLTKAREEIDRLRPALARHPEAHSLATVAALIVNAALQRRESRGAHHRLDYPDLDVMLDHSIISDVCPANVAVAG